MSALSSPPLEVLEDVDRVLSFEAPGDGEGREGDLTEEGVGRVLPRDFAGTLGVGEDELEPGSEDVPEGRRLVLLLGADGSSVPETAFW